MNVDENAVNDSAPAPTVAREDQIRMILNLLSPWLDKGALNGAFSLDAAFQIFLFLKLLQAEPGTRLVNQTNKKDQISRVAATRGLFEALNRIQKKGGILTNLDEASQIVEMISILEQLLVQEEKETPEDQQKEVAEVHFLPKDLNQLAEKQFSELIIILEGVISRGQAQGSLPLELVNKVCVSLRVLKQGVSAAWQKDGKVILSGVQAFGLVHEAINQIVTHGGCQIPLIELVQLHCIIVQLKKDILAHLQSSQAKAVAEKGQTDGPTTARGTKRVKSEEDGNAKISEIS